MNIDIDLLKRQQVCLLRLIDVHQLADEDVELLDGLINMIDAICDEREGLNRRPPKGGDAMKQYRIWSDYGTFEITKLVEAEDEDEAWQETGIMADLIDAGWTIVSSPEGEEHDVQEVTT